MKSSSKMTDADQGYLKITPAQVQRLGGYGRASDALRLPQKTLRWVLASM